MSEVMDDLELDDDELLDAGEPSGDEETLYEAKIGRASCRERV